jgi:hypothetical protein
VAVPGSALAAMGIVLVLGVSVVVVPVVVTAQQLHGGSPAPPHTAAQSNDTARESRVPYLVPVTYPCLARARLSLSYEERVFEDSRLVSDKPHAARFVSPSRSGADWRPIDTTPANPFLVGRGNASHPASEG